jgi:hypothetical protein
MATIPATRIEEEARSVTGMYKFYRSGRSSRKSKLGRVRLLTFRFLFA